MRDYITIGSTPYGEDCAQVGRNNYYEMSRIECKVFTKQLLRIFGKGTENNSIVTKSFAHDFGTYREVCVYFDDLDEASTNYAFNIEGDTPEFWDDEAKVELESLGYKL